MVKHQLSPNYLQMVLHCSTPSFLSTPNSLMIRHSAVVNLCYSVSCQACSCIVFFLSNLNYPPMASILPSTTRDQHQNDVMNASRGLQPRLSTSAAPSPQRLCLLIFFIFFRFGPSNTVPPASFTNTQLTNAFEEVAPSTNTSIPMKKLPYDVFINHRGPDCKHTLATTLYNTLSGMGFRVFIDSQELELGDFLPGEIEAAMRSASLHIAIFSPNYAQSPWCLAELSFMLKTGTQIVPVFYNVQPDDVRYCKGVYADAFYMHVKKGRYTTEKLQEWKNALYSVSYNVGHIINKEDDEGRLLKKIVSSALKVTKKVPFVVAKHPIGLDYNLHHQMGSDCPYLSNYSVVCYKLCYCEYGSGDYRLTNNNTRE